MDTRLTEGTEHTIIRLAHAFDGYAYARQAWAGDDAQQQEALTTHYRRISEEKQFWLRSEDNLAVNFYLHRTFHHLGYLPHAGTPEWYDMLFLYLHLYRTPVPVAFRHSSMYSEWQQRPKGAAEAAAAEIRQVLIRFRHA